jgi:hypothetical protein
MAEMINGNTLIVFVTCDGNLWHIQYLYIGGVEVRTFCGKTLKNPAMLMRAYPDRICSECNKQAMEQLEISKNLQGHSRSL